MGEKNYVFIVQVTRHLCVDILNAFADKGVSTELYTGEISNSYNDLDKKIKIHFLCKYDKHNSFKRILTWIVFTFQVFFKLLFKKKKDLELVFISTPPFVTFLGLFFKKIFNLNYHLIIWDLYPEALLSLKNSSQKDFIYRSWEKANYDLFNHACTVITIGNYMAKAISKYLLALRQPEIIYNWVDTKYIYPIKKINNWFASRYNQSDKLTILYSGNMGDTHDFKSLLKVAEHLKAYKDICFLIIGEGVQKSFIEDTIKNKELYNVILLPYQDKAVLPFSLATGDIGIVSLDKGMENVSFPSKTYSILASGNAMLALASKNSELGLIVNKYNCGEVFENGDIEGISDFILSLNSNRALLEEYKKNSRLASQDFTPLNANQYFRHITRHSQSSRLHPTSYAGTP